MSRLARNQKPQTLWLIALITFQLAFPSGYAAAETIAQLGEMTPAPTEEKPSPDFALPAAGALPAPPAVKKEPVPTTVQDSAAQKNSADSTVQIQTPTQAPAQIQVQAVTQPAATAQPVTTVPAAAVQPATSNVIKAIANSVSNGNQPVPQEFVLANGLKVLILESHEFPLVSSLIWYKVGSRNEDIGTTGLCHLLEHLLFQNVGSFHTGEIGSSIARYGGQFNGYTSDDFTTFFETLPANKLELALKIEAERMRSARFNEADITQEKNNILKEFENEAKDPAALLSREIRALMFMQHPYRNPTLGWKSDLENIKTAQVKAFYDRFFLPNNATLIICGDVQSKAALPLIQKYFGQIPGNAAIDRIKISEPISHSERRVSLKYNGKQELMQVVYHSPALDESDAPAMVVLEKILTGGNAGRLKSKLIDSKVCSNASASYEIKKDPGLFSITCTAVPSTYNAQQKIQENIDSLINQLKEKPVTDAELKRAKNQAEFAFYSECDGPYRSGFHLGYFDSLHTWQSSYSWADRIRSVTAADLLRVAKKYFNTDARVIGWVAGNSAPKPTAPKPAPGEPAKDHDKKEHDKTAPAKHPEHVRLTGYKESDSAQSPNKEKKSNIPFVIREIPTAVGNVVNGLSNIPTAVGATASAIGKQIAQLHPGQDGAGRSVKRILKNGLTLYIFESRLSPIVQMNASIAAGDIYNPQEKPGVSAVVAALLNQGNAKHNKSQIQIAQDDLGIPAFHMLKFENEQETIDFQTRCLARDLSTQLDLIAETLSSPSMEESSLDKAKQEAQSTLRKNEDGVIQKIDRALLHSLLTEKSPYCPPDPSEKSKSISAVSVADIQKFISSHIVPGTTKLVIAGNTTPDQAVALAERAFAKWSEKSTPTVMHAHQNIHKVLRTSIPIKDSKKSTICFGQLIPFPPSHPDYGNLLIADGILINHPIVSRFEQQLSKNPAFEAAINNADITVKLEPLSNLTKWYLSLSVEPNAVPLAVSAIKHELRQLSRTGVTQEEFNEAKRYLLGSLPIKTAATLSLISKSLLDSAEHSDTADSLSLQLAGLKSASIESVNKFIRNAFKPEQSTLIVSGSGQSIKAAHNQSAANSSNTSLDKKPETSAVKSAGSTKPAVNMEKVNQKP